MKIFILNYDDRNGIISPMKTLKKMIIIIISAALLSSCASLGKPSGASIAAIEDAVNDGSPSSSQ